MNPKLAKTIAKFAVMGIGSLMIGQIIKLEKKLDQRIEEHFVETETESEKDN